MKVRMEDGRVVEMTRAELARALRRSLGEWYRREAGIRAGDSEAMVDLKIGIYYAVQNSTPQPGR